MIEVPRAALTAAEIAAQADFFPRYLALGILETSPFESVDVPGIGRLVDIAVTDARAVRPDLRIGVCGEHGGDPASIHFFHRAHLDYVSCSPYRVPIARLESGRAAVTGSGSDSR
jgi:pyruvate,orthophosphate dikinase